MVAPESVLNVRPIRTILLATDLTAASREATDHAIDLAGRDLLDAVHQNGPAHTLYSNVYDLKNKLVVSKGDVTKRNKASAILAAAADQDIAGVICDSSFRSLRDTVAHHLVLARSWRWWLRGRWRRLHGEHQLQHHLQQLQRHPDRGCACLLYRSG